MARSKQVTIRPSDGGHLITVASQDNVGPANYTAKTNWRRLDDAEIVREGTLAHSTLPTGTIALFEAVRPNGDKLLIACTASAIYKYAAPNWSSIGSGFSATFWEGASLDGYLVLNNSVDLPVYFQVQDSAVTPLYELRDVGVAYVGTMTVYNGFLLFADISEIADLATWMNGATPYGRFTGTVNRVKYKIAWSDYNSPTNWSPVITGTIQASTKNIVTLAYPVSAFPIGSKVAVIGAGVGGGTLGGHEGFEDGVPVTDVSGAVLTLGTSSDASLTYPLTVQVTRFADTSTFAGSATIQDDSSAIIALRTLKRVLIVYRETGIFSGRYTNSVESPFVFTPEYRGTDVPLHSRCIADLAGDAHIYPTKTRFMSYDGASNPILFGPLDNARTLFFASSSATFASHNPLTKELWFHNSNGVLAYDYVTRTASWIDQAYAAATPFSSDAYVLLAAPSNAGVLYGRSTDGTVTARNRLTVPFTATLTRGKTSGGDDFADKELLQYSVMGSTNSTDVTVTATVRGSDSIPATEDTLFIEAEALTNPVVECFFRNVYFSDTITATSGADTRLTGVMYRYQLINTQGVSRGD